MVDEGQQEKPAAGEDEQSQILELLKSGFDTEHTLNRRVGKEEPDEGNPE